MELNKILKNRRSSRYYLKKSVPRDMLEELVISATEAPVSCNLQVTQYLVIDDQNILDRLIKQVSYKFAYTPAYFLILYDPRFTVERDSIISSSAMSAENIILRATDLGLATCPMAGFENDKLIKEILSIPKHIEILLMISVGFADPSFEPLPPYKIDYKKSFSFNNYGDMKTLNPSNNLKDQNIEDIIDYRSRISTVYLDRFRLNTYKESYYERAYDFFIKDIEDLRIKRIIDIMSYDGTFLRFLDSNKNLSITSSDYLKKNLDFFHKTFNCSTVEIDSSNSFNTKEKYECATLVYQAEFTPHLPTLIKNIFSLLEIGGVLFMAISTESWYKRFIKFMLKQYRRFILNKLNNIYEGNVFYKIGPRTHITKKYIEGICKKYNFTITKKETLIAGRGSKINLYMLTKSSEQGIQSI